jgi:hypothetical protein
MMPKPFMPMDYMIAVYDEAYKLLSDQGRSAETLRAAIYGGASDEDLEDALGTLKEAEAQARREGRPEAAAALNYAWIMVNLFHAQTTTQAMKLLDYHTSRDHQ